MNKENERKKTLTVYTSVDREQILLSAKCTISTDKEIYKKRENRIHVDNECLTACVFIYLDRE